MCRQLIQHSVTVCKTTKELFESEGCIDGVPVLFICCVGVVWSNLGLLGPGGGSGLLNGLFPADLFLGGCTELDFLGVSLKLIVWELSSIESVMESGSGCFLISSHLSG